MREIVNTKYIHPTRKWTEKKRHENNDEEETEHEINIFRFSVRYSRMLYMSTLDLIEVELFQVNAFVTNGCPSQRSKRSHVDCFFFTFSSFFGLLRNDIIFASN